MKFGVYSVCIPHLTPEQAVVEVKDAGFGGIEWRVAINPSLSGDAKPDFFVNNRCTISSTPEACAHAARLCAEAGL